MASKSRSWLSDTLVALTLVLACTPEVGAQPAPTAHAKLDLVAEPVLHVVRHVTGWHLTLLGRHADPEHEAEDYKNDSNPLLHT